MSMKEMKLLSPTGIVGYGFPEKSFRKGIAMRPDIIAVDAGSSDPGPYYLGSGKSFTTLTAVKRDLELMITAGCELNIPVVIGSAGGAGANPHLARETGIILEIAREHRLSFKLATIEAEIDKGFLAGELERGMLSPLGSAPSIRHEDIISSVHIVAQMGNEPIMSALDQGAQVILCGRCYDPAVFAAPAIRLGYSPALALHAGKILECAAIAATPGSASDCMMGFIGDDYFCVEPLADERRCTVTSVAAHTLYEKSDPRVLYGPGHLLDLSGCAFTQVSSRRVKVTGTRCQALPYTIKLEGSKSVGFRTISIAGNRDPIFIAQSDRLLEEVRSRVEENLSGISESYQLDFIIYGKNGVMGPHEPLQQTASHELCFIIDVTAKSQEIANTVCAVSRSTLLHLGYEGRISTGGNLAFPYSPSDMEAGEVFQFSLYGLLEVDDPNGLFPINYYGISKGRVSEE